MAGHEVVKETQKKAAAILLLLIMAAASVFPAFAQTNSERQTVRVGFFAWDGYHVEDEQGIKSGYGYDFLKMMEEYNNWNYEYKGYDKSWAQMLEMLDNDEIDMVTSAQKTAEWTEKYDFSESTIGTSATIMTVKKDDTRYMTGDPGTYDGIRVGMLADSSRNARFAAFAAEEGFTYQPVYYKDMEEMSEAFQVGEHIDAMLGSNLRALNNETILEEFDPVDFYVVVKKGNTALLEQINHAITQMDMNTPGWRLSLKNKYYSDIANNVLSFNRDELEYLKLLKSENIVFKVVTNPDLAPYSYWDNGAAKGMAPRIFEELAARIGIQYEYIPLETYKAYNEYVHSGQADIDLTCFSDYGLAEYHGIDLSNAYMSTTLALLTRDSFSGKPHILAELEKSDKNTTYSSEIFSLMECISYDTNEACVQAVVSGQADGVYLYTYSAQKAVESDARNRLRYTILPEYSVNLAMGINEQLDYRLLAVINKGIRNVKGRFTQQVMQEEVSRISVNASLVAFLYDYPLIAVVGVMTVLVVGFMIFTIIIKNKNNRKMSQQSAALADALEVARSASTAKGQFLSRMSHEIRTPLNAVIGYMDMAKDSKNNTAKLMHCVENSDMAAKHLLSIINDVLDISSIESGRMKISHTEFDLKQQLMTISTLFYNQAKNKGIQFEVQLEDIIREWVIGDSLRVNQILMNLLSNAVKFTPAGGCVCLKVSQTDTDQTKVFMVFEVSDTGIGMSEAYQQKLFTPFEQESAETAQKYGGTGLGLSIAYNLVHMMGGNIEVRSRQGEGTVFTLSLYFEKSETEHITAARHDYSHVRALIVDDDKASCDYMKALLKRCGVKCDVVMNGSDALRQIRRRMDTEYKYNLCILDWSMPAMDGIETAKQIRSEYPSDMPIIIATAYDVTALEDEAASVGIDRFIAKPLFQSTMFDLLVSVYGRYEPVASNRQRPAQLQGVRVLLAEDNDMNMEIAVNMLTKAGMIVEEAVDGQRVCDKFIQSPENTFDIVLMDVQMPVMDGYKATAVIRQSGHPQARTIPIVAMTANAFAEDVTAALASGMNDHISKPIDHAKLFSVLDKYIKKQGGEDHG